MKHLRSDYDAIQPWPQKRAHVVREYHDDGSHVVSDVSDWPDDEVAVSVSACELGPIIPADEPVFLLRGQDPSSGPAVRAWADDFEARGGNPEHAARVREWAKEMEMFARNNPSGMKQVADVPEGMLR